MITLIKKAFVTMLAATGILWLPFDISTYNDPQHKFSVDWYIISLGAIFLCTIIWLLLNQRKFSHHFKQQGITFTVAIGDIFSFGDGAVISFSDTFDTEISNELISRYSLQAIFRHASS